MNLTDEELYLVAKELQERLITFFKRKTNKTTHYPGIFPIMDSIRASLGDEEASLRVEVTLPLIRNETDESPSNVPSEETTTDREETSNRIEGRDRGQDTIRPTDKQHEGKIESRLRSKTMGETIPPLPQKIDKESS